MRIGLVTDIHSHAAELTRALELFRAEGVEQVVTLGDTVDAFSSGEGAPEVTALLAGVNAVGVWGNHDFSLCRETPPRVRDRFDPAVLEFMATMQPRLIRDGIHFSHEEASVDPNDITQLWGFGEGQLDLMERARLGFTAAPERWQFVGHYHRWWAATPDRPLDWDGSGPLHLEPDQRYFVVVGAVFDGWCGILDTDSGMLHPHRCPVG